MPDVKSESLFRRLWPWLVGAVGLVAFVLGWYGFHLVKFSDPTKESTLWDELFGTMGLFVFNTPDMTGDEVNWPLNWARYLAFIATISAGATAVFTLFHEEFTAWRLRQWRNHTVICGLGFKGFTFVQNLHKHDKVVVVESDPDNSTIEDCRRLGVPVIIGDAQHDGVLARAGVARAAKLLAVCPDDSVNTEILLSARVLVQKRKEGNLLRRMTRRFNAATTERRRKVLIRIRNDARLRRVWDRLQKRRAQRREHRQERTLRCLAQISHPQLCAMLRDIQVWEEDEAWTADFFNTDDTSATLVLDLYPVTVGDEPPHLLVANLDSLGERLIVLAAQRWLNRPRPVGEESETRLVMTILDDDADDRLALLKRQNAELRDERAFTFITCSTSAKEVEQLRDRFAAEGVPNPVRAYVTAAQDDQGVATALLLLSRLNVRTKVIVALSRAHGTGKVLDESPRVDVEVFPRFERTCTRELLFEVSVKRLAMEIHEIWREEQLARVAKIDRALARLAEATDDETARALLKVALAAPETDEPASGAEQEASAEAKAREALRTIKEVLATIDGGQDPQHALATITTVVETLSHERDGIKDPPSWEAATAQDRASSMAQAHDIPAKLRTLDAVIEPLPDEDDEEAEVVEFVLTPGEIERLAYHEHDRWVAERRNSGWTDGKRDKANKVTPYLVPFGDLPEDVAEWDRVFVRKIPRILERAGYRAVRNSAPEPAAPELARAAPSPAL